MDAAGLSDRSRTVAAKLHQFYAIAFEENFPLRQISRLFPAARLAPHQLHLPIEPEGGMYVYPFGAVVTYDVAAERREAELERLRQASPKLTTKVVRETYTVLEDRSFVTGISDGMLRLDRFTEGRAGIVALIVAQSAAMEYYEHMVESLFKRTSTFVERLERRGSVPLRTRPLHRFIGEAMSARAEVLSVLHLLDKPDEAWEDPAMDRIYGDLRAEFDLADRHHALEFKLRSIQEALVLLVGVIRDRQLLLLELAVLFLILLEVIISLPRFW